MNPLSQLSQNAPVEKGRPVTWRYTKTLWGGHWQVPFRHETHSNLSGETSVPCGHSWHVGMKPFLAICLWLASQSHDRLSLAGTVELGHTSHLENSEVFHKELRLTLDLSDWNIEYLCSFLELQMEYLLTDTEHLKMEARKRIETSSWANNLGDIWICG